MYKNFLLVGVLLVQLCCLGLEPVGLVLHVVGPLLQLLPPGGILSLTFSMMSRSVLACFPSSSFGLSTSRRWPL